MPAAGTGAASRSKVIIKVAATWHVVEIENTASDAAGIDDRTPNMLVHVPRQTGNG
jgi:hypothetical protein